MLLESLGLACSVLAEVYASRNARGRLAACDGFLTTLSALLDARLARAYPNADALLEASKATRGVDFHARGAFPRDARLLLASNIIRVESIVSKRPTPSREARRARRLRGAPCGASTWGPLPHPTRVTHPVGGRRATVSE